MIIITFSNILFAQEEQIKPASENKQINIDATFEVGEPVIIADNELFRIHSSLGPFSSKERATAITLGYDVPWKKVHNTLINAAFSTRNVKKEPSPFVHQTSLGDFNITT